VKNILKQGVELPDISYNENLDFAGVTFHEGEYGGEKGIALHFWRE
jgi:hypothetical protein